MSFAVLEASLRQYDRWLAARATPPAVILPLLQENPHGTGSYRMRPGVDLEARLGSQRIPVRTNSHGMRWREVTLAKPPERSRIAILGDSFAFGCWADRVEDSLAGVFERNISPTRWEVLNFGIGGYGPADEELQLTEEVLAFSPDYVVLVLFTGNDFRDAYLGIDKARIVRGTAELRDEIVRARVPESELQEDSTRSRPTPPRGLRRWLAPFAVFRHLLPLLGLDDPRIEFAVNRNFTMFTYWSQHPHPEAALRARDATLAILDRMHAALGARGIRFGIVVVPYKEQVTSRLLAGPDFDVSFPQLWVQARARERGLPYLDTLPLLRARTEAGRRPLFHRNDIHLTQEGHRVVGEAMADWFRCCLRDARIVAGGGAQEPAAR